MKLLRACPGCGFSLRSKLFGGAILLVGALGVASFFSIQAGLRKILKEEMLRRGATVADLISHSAEEALLIEDLYSLHSLIRAARDRHKDVRYIFVVDAEGSVVAHTFSGGFPKRLRELNAPLPSEAYSEKNFRTGEGRVLDVALSLGGGRGGQVHIGLKEYEISRRMVAVAWRGGLVLSCVLAVWLIGAYWLADRISGRIRRLVEVSGRFGRGELAVRAAEKPSDEVGMLGASLNGMAERLARSQEQLIGSAKLAAVGELASSVAHEVNNPLNNMGICVQALQERAREPRLLRCREFEDFPEYLAAVKKEIFRCKKITSGLLDFVRRTDPRKEVTDVNKIVKQVLSVVDTRCRSQGVRVILELSEERVAASMNEDHFRQVLLNLYNNALDEMPGGGELTLRTEAGEHFASVRVADTGSGFPAESRPRIFEPFFSTKTKKQGTGLGLTVCKRLILEYGGRIEAANIPAGGAVVSVELPRALGAVSQDPGKEGDHA